MINIHKRLGVKSFRMATGWQISTGEEVVLSLDAESLTDADLRGADLRWSNLAGANLRGADMSKTLLEGADLSNADLTGANLRQSTLNGCILTRAILRGACLAASMLGLAKLDGADLTGSDLEGANIRFCHYDSDTKWPVGVDPVAWGAGPSAARQRYEQQVRAARSGPDSEDRAGVDE